MNKYKILSIGLVLLFVLSAMPSMQVAADPSGGHMSYNQDPHSGAIFVKTDTLTVKMNPTFPAFTFFYTPTNARGTIYYTGYTQLIEFNDANGDGAFQRNETVKLVSLPMFQWSISINEIKDSNGTLKEIRVTYTKTGISPEMQMHHIPVNYSVEDLNNFTMQFVAHIYTYEYTGEVAGDNESINYTVTPQSEMKVDIIMSKFPFVNSTDLITLRVDLRTVTPRQARIIHRIRMMNHTELVNASQNWYRNGTLERVIKHLRHQTMSQIDMDNDNTTTGFFKWLNTAVITRPGQEDELVNVTASYAPDGIGVRVYLTYPNFDGGTLIHDPSIGLSNPSGSPLDYLTPSNVAIIGISTVAILAIVIAIKKRK